MSFYVNWMNYLNSNITSKMFCASIGFKVLRIARRISDLVNMVTRVNFCWKEWKSRVTDVLVSFQYWKRSLGKTLKFADIGDKFTNLFICNSFYLILGACIFLCVYVWIYVHLMYIFYVFYILYFICVFVLMSDMNTIFA